MVGCFLAALAHNILYMVHNYALHNYIHRAYTYIHYNIVMNIVNEGNSLKLSLLTTYCGQLPIINTAQLTSNLRTKCNNLEMLYSLLVLLFISPALTYLCSCVNRPELVLLTGSSRSGHTFCLGKEVQLKCIFPEGVLALEWYVNGSKRPINVDYLAEVLPGHNATTLFGNFTIVSIFKEESFRGNYSCAVSIPGRDVRSNSVEVLFKGIL